jgi:hypothetical protein
MSRFTEMIVLVALFALRLGVPVVLTFAVGFLLRRLDMKWEADAQREAVETTASVAPAAPKRSKSLPCWLIKGCSEDMVRNCPAHQNQSLPCWLARLRAEGRIPQLCATCDLFRTPAPSHI